MAKSKESSVFTTSEHDEKPFGPPLIGALLRMPWDAVQQHMLDRLHESGFGDFDAAYLTVFQYPGPQGARPSELAARLRIFFFSSRRRHTRSLRDWSSDVCSSD